MEGEKRAGTEDGRGLIQQANQMGMRKQAAGVSPVERSPILCKRGDGGLVE